MDQFSVAELIKQLRSQKNLTQQELANLLEIKRSRLANFENKTSRPNKEILKKLYELGLPQPKEVGPPLIPASQLLVPVPYLGYIAASDPVDWTDPFESETFEYVPPEMGDARGRFACRIASDSMFPLLEPHDVCVFQKTDVPKIGHVILFRSKENRVTVKQLKHNGSTYILNPINSSYKPIPAEGTMLGFLVGIVRERGTQRITIFDSTGIFP